MARGPRELQMERKLGRAGGRAERLGDILVPISTGPRDHPAAGYQHPATGTFPAAPPGVPAPPSRAPGGAAAPDAAPPSAGWGQWRGGVEGGRTNSDGLRCSCNPTAAKVIQQRGDGLETPGGGPPGEGSLFVPGPGTCRGRCGAEGATALAACPKDASFPRRRPAVVNPTPPPRRPPPAFLPAPRRFPAPLLSSPPSPHPCAKTTLDPSPTGRWAEARAASMVPRPAGTSGRAEGSLTPPVLPTAGDGGPGAGEADAAGADRPGAGGQAAAHAPQDVPQPGSGDLQVTSAMGSSRFPQQPGRGAGGLNPARRWARRGVSGARRVLRRGSPAPHFQPLQMAPDKGRGCQGTGGTISMRIGAVPEARGLPGRA